MALSNLEKETIIIFNEAEPTANITTFNKKLIRRMNERCSENKGFICVKKGIDWAEYSCPKKYVTVRAPKKLTEEQRTEAAKRAKERFGGGVTHE